MQEDRHLSGLVLSDWAAPPPSRPERTVAHTEDVLVTLAEIARLADVGRAAVSNWRKRHDSFPEPVGGTDVSPLFSLTAVEQWLHDQGKLPDISEAERLWPHLDHLGDRGQSGQIIAATVLNSWEGSPRISRKPELSLRTNSEPLLRHATTVAANDRAPGETFEYLLGRWLDTNVRQITTTPRGLAALMTSVAVRWRAAPDVVPRSVYDPACGTGTILASAADLLGAPKLRLVGTELDPVLAAITVARLVTEISVDTESEDMVIDVATGDSLLDDPHFAERADLVLCNPPFNTRDWGYELLATDPRWRFGLPPRGESELAWVQHIVSRLAPDGTAVVVVPPSAAARKGGRRVRAGLVRTGTLRAVIALPVGAASPYSVALQLWVLQSPERTNPHSHEVELVDASDMTRPTTDEDWTALTAAIVRQTAARQQFEPPPEVAVVRRSVPAMDLLSEEVDVTPARHVVRAADRPEVLATAWSDLTTAAAGVGNAAAELSALKWSNPDSVGSTTIGELLRAGVLDLHTGQSIDPETVHNGIAGDESVLVLMVPDLVARDGSRRSMNRAEAVAGGHTLTENDDVVVAGVTRAFSAWVEENGPTVLGPQLFALRTDPNLLDPWFVAACLRAPTNFRQAGTQTPSSTRIDIRKLRVPQLPIEDQRAYGTIHRRIAQFERDLRDVDRLGTALVSELSDRMAGGRLGFGH
jgi:type I restriction-modification system DNA methylase subunit